jgi:hypothetical protein
MTCGTHAAGMTYESSIVISSWRRRSGSAMAAMAMILALLDGRCEEQDTTR